MNWNQLLELSPYFVLAILFVVPFVDPRRPFRRLHLDVLVLSGFGLYSIALLDRGPLFASIRWSTVIAALGLLYILVRSGYAVLRPARAEPGELTWVPLPWLKWSIVVLMGFRLVFPFADDRLVIDVGLASVAGAEQILADGEEPLGAGGTTSPWAPSRHLRPRQLPRLRPLRLGDRLTTARRSSGHERVRRTMLASVIVLGWRLGGRRRRTEPRAPPRLCLGSIPPTRSSPPSGPTTTCSSRWPSSSP